MDSNAGAPREGDGPLPYAGLRVIDLASAEYPLCAQLLGQLGAEVVMVEPGAANDSRNSADWIAYNAGKKSINVEDRSELERLVAAADVLIDCTGSAGSTMALPNACALNPRLVHATLSPYGSSGPKSAWRSSELVGQAAGGILHMSGSAEWPPARLGFPLATGMVSAQAMTGVLLALAARVRSGRGARIDVSMQESVANLLFGAQSAAHVENVALGRGASQMGSGTARRRGIWLCKDGYLAWNINAGLGQGRKNEPTFAWMVEAGFAEVASLRKVDWEALSVTTLSQSQMEAWETIFERFYLTQTKDQASRAGAKHRILMAVFNDMADIARDPVLVERAAWLPLDLPDGSTGEVVGTPFRSTAYRVRLDGRIPKLGEHRDEVLRTWATPRHAAPVSAPAGLPLAGLRVLDFSWAIINPITTKYLAMFGADVIKLEWRKRPDPTRMSGPFPLGKPGIDMSASFVNINATKRSAAFNITDAGLRDTILKMAATADIVLENFVPGTLAKYGFDYDSLRAVNPDLIMLSSSLAGQTGSLARQPGLGSHLQAMAGIDLVTGHPKGPPGGPSQVMPDFIGPWLVIAALLAALEHRRRTGEGQYVDLSQYEAIQTFLRPLMVRYRLDGVAPQRQGASGSPSLCPEGLYPSAGDDRWIAITVEDDAAWMRLHAQLPSAIASRFPARMTLHERVAQRAALDESLAEWTRDQDPLALAERLQSQGIAASAVNNALDLRDDAQLRHREHYRFVEHARIGRVPVDAPSFRIEGIEPHIIAGPGYGTATRAVLQEWIGLDSAAIEALIASGAIEAR
jgi:crotonobetainyl-CoA:carnitine CoA-transferase CaiB-like acyl-CoA transferase